MFTSGLPEFIRDDLSRHQSHKLEHRVRSSAKCTDTGDSSAPHYTHR